jgi:hypothetical protein
MVCLVDQKEMEWESSMVRSKNALIALGLFLLLLTKSGSGVAQDAPLHSAVPRLLKSAGVLKDAQGKPRSGSLNITFSVYSDPEGGDPLWTETQTLAVTDDGAYEVLLGSTTSHGLPEDLFGGSASGSTGSSQPVQRWLGVQVEQEPEQRPREALVSVPYALKAADAETLGGRPASDFALADSLKTLGGPSEPGLPTTASGILSIDTLTSQAQMLATGTSGSDFNIVSLGGKHTFNLPDASTTARGAVTTGAQSFAGPKTFTGGILAKSVNHILEADQFSGADMGQQLTACLAAVPSGGGVCDARGITGSQTASSTVAIPANVQLLLGAVTLTSTASVAFTMDNSSSIVGLASNATEIVLNSTNGKAIMSVNQAVEKDFLLLDSFSLVQSGTATSSIGIDWSGVSNSRVQDVRLFGFATQILVDGGVGGLTAYDDYDHLTIASGKAAPCTGVFIRRSAEDQRFFGISFTYLTYQFTIGTSTDLQNPVEIDCFGCTFEGAALISLNIVRGSSIYFSGGRFEGNNTAIQTAADPLVQGVVIDSPDFGSNTVNLNDNAGSASIRGNSNFAQTSATGLSTSPGQNLMPNAMMEGWNGTKNLLGWSSLSGPDWNITGEATQETTVKNSGLYGVRIGDNTPAFYRGIDTTNRIFIDPTQPYTLTFLWTTPDAANAKMRFAFRLFDKSGALIKTGTVVGDSVDPTTGSTSPASLNYASEINAHVLASDQSPLTANVLQRFTEVVRFPPNTASLQFAIFIGITSTRNVYVYMDDIYFSQGQASTQPTAAPLGDSGPGGIVNLYSSLVDQGGITVGPTGTLVTRMGKYTVALDPAPVAATTCAEQIFTVTGVQAADVIIAANKPSTQPGLGIAGVRAAANNAIGINFCNETSSSITPAPGETYTFSVLQ